MLLNATIDDDLSFHFSPPFIIKHFCVFSSHNIHKTYVFMSYIYAYAIMDKVLPILSTV